MKQLLLCVTLFFTIQFNAQCWQLVSTGGDHFVAVKTDGTLWVWGSNEFGQLGNGTSVSSTVPVQVNGDTDWVYAEAGEGHTIAIKANGTLWAWGLNETGQVGIASTMSTVPLPVQVGSDSDWNTVSCRGYTTMAVKNDGTLWGWGNNSSGQLGDNTFINRTAPVQIGTATNWKSVSSSFYHSAAVKTNGTLWTWGDNASGQLGNMMFNTPFYVPTQMGIETDWNLTAAGTENTVAIKNDGTLWAWGWNADGQLGNGNTTSLAVATPIGTGTNWQTVSSGLWVMLAIQEDGSLWGAGNNLNGQLGNGSQVSVVGLNMITTDANWASVSSNGYMTSAIKTDGTLWTWGYNEGRILGNGSENNLVLAPTEVACPVASIKAIQSNTVTVYPNPAKDIITITDTFGLPAIDMVVTDVFGKIVMQQQAVSGSINVQTLSAGMYLLKINIGTEQYVIKIIKQ